ncbi:MAG: hypothetical protein FJ161_03490 [Gammaproteobacteria bacterium]|nr:hypothetical protein [Gammaproteobacteria bacterium]
MLHRRPGFSFLDMMMYVSLVALSLHYAVPCYRLLITKMRSQKVIQHVQEVQLELYEQVLLTGSFPEQYQIEVERYDQEMIREIEWNGHSLTVALKERSSQDDYELTLTPTFDDYRIQWECDYDGSQSMKTYLCYALT